MITIEHSINKIGLKFAFASAVLGTLQVLIYAIFPNDNSLMVGLFHLYPTVLVHAIVLLMVISKGIYRKSGLQETALTIFIMLLNIPLAYFCAWLVLDILM